MARPIVVLLVLVLVVCLSEVCAFFLFQLNHRLSTCIFSFQQALRCRTEDGPSTEEIKKVVRTCMRRSSDRHQSAAGNGHGHAFDRSDYDDDDDSDASYESDSTSADSRNSDRDDRNNNNHQRNHDNNHRHGQDTYDDQNRQNHQQQQQRTNFDPYQQQQQQQQGDGNNYPYNNRYGMVRSMINRRSAQMHNTQMAQTQRQLNHSSGLSGHDSGAHHMTGMYNNRGGNSSDNGNGSTTSDQQQQSSCMVQCFFQELKMVKA